MAKHRLIDVCKREKVVFNGLFRVFYALSSSSSMLVLPLLLLYTVISLASWKGEMHVLVW